jgi:uncharacterized protein
MSAVQQSKTPEPTMEEILASIRQIISDDQPAAKPSVVQAVPAAPQPQLRAAPAPAPVPAPADDDILDLIAPAKPAARPTPSPEQSFAALSQAVEYDRLLSNQAASAASSSFGALAHTVLTQNARTLDDIVLELLKPLIKTWLDDNLPTVVERLVRSEIERVARGGR